MNRNTRRLLHLVVASYCVGAVSASADVIKLRTDCDEGARPEITTIGECVQSVEAVTDSLITRLGGTPAIPPAGCDSWTVSAEPLCKETIDEVLAEIHDPTAGRALPSATNPVVIDIGPGVFSLTSTTWKYCQPVNATLLSHLTFRGAGEQATVLTGGGFDPYEDTLDDGGDRVVAIENCDDVEFRELTIRSGSMVPTGVEFAGDGETYWNNVTIDAETYA
jgi:hypothetical protein